ncbi:DMT family transporter [Psychrobacter sp. 1U2]|uniref:DMT family transporter n=1 Tax=Psychrobacter sp. 1U2 TaxID=3453577 RepID=UPI003F46A388
MSDIKEKSASDHRQLWWIPLLCLLVGGALLGIATNLAKFAVEIGLTPLAFLFWSISGAAIILSIVAYMRDEVLAPSARSFEYYIVAALVSVAGSNLIFFSAIPHVGAGFVALIISLPPLLTYLAALVISIERFNSWRALGVAAALAGAGVLAARKFSAPEASIFWIALALCGPVLLAIGNIYRSLRWPDNASPIALAPGMLIAAAIMLGLVGLLPGFTLAIPAATVFPISLIVLQACIFAGQFLLLFVLQKTGGPVLLSLLGAVGAVVGVPVAVFLQGEAVPEGLVLGGSLIALGVALVTWGGLTMTKVNK